MLTCNAGVLRGHLLERSFDWRFCDAKTVAEMQEAGLLFPVPPDIPRPEQWCCIRLVPHLIGNTAAVLMKPSRPALHM